MSSGRPEKPIDWDRVDYLLEVGCNGCQIASEFNIHHDTLYNRIRDRYGMIFSEYSAKMGAKGEKNLLEVQYEKAMTKDNTMMIWLGKQRLKQRENYQEVNNDAPKQNEKDLSDKLEKAIYEIKQLKEKLNAIEPKTEPVI